MSEISCVRDESTRLLILIIDGEPYALTPSEAGRVAQLIGAELVMIDPKATRQLGELFILGADGVTTRS